MGEHRAAADVADRPDALHLGVEPLVHLDDALVAGRESDPVEAEIVGIGPAADCHEKVRCLDVLRTLAGFDGQRQSGGELADAAHRRIHPEADAFAFQDLLQALGDILVLVAGDLRILLDDRDLAAHAAVELAHLEPDVSADDDDQVFRQLRVVEPVFAVQEVDFVEMPDRRQDAAGAGVEDDLLGQDFLAAGVEPEMGAILADEAGMGPDQGRVVGMLEAAAQAPPRRRGDVAGPLQDLRKIHPDAVDHDAVIARPARQMGHPRRSDGGLGQGMRQGNARLPAADDEHVKYLCHHGLQSGSRISRPSGQALRLRGSSTTSGAGTSVRSATSRQ